MSSRSFREDKADIAVLDFLLSLYKTSYRVAVTLNEDSSSYSYYKSSERSVVCCKVSTDKCSHMLEMPLGKILAYKYAVSEALVVGSDDIRVLLGKVLSSDTAHLCEDIAKEKKAVLCYYSYCSSSCR